MLHPPGLTEQHLYSLTKGQRNIQKQTRKQ